MGKREILFVEDDASILELFAQAFSKAGYGVQTAGNAEEAQEILKTRHFNVMFLDLALPGMSGIDLCKKIKKEKPLTIVFAVTGYASVFELSDCREAGFEDYFTKPADLQLLFDAAAQAFEKVERWKRR